MGECRCSWVLVAVVVVGVECTPWLVQPGAGCRPWTEQEEEEYRCSLVPAVVVVAVGECRLVLVPVPLAADNRSPAVTTPKRPPRRRPRRQRL